MSGEMQQNWSLQQLRPVQVLQSAVSYHMPLVGRRALAQNLGAEPLAVKTVTRF